MIFVSDSNKIKIIFTMELWLNKIPKMLATIRRRMHSLLYKNEDTRIYKNDIFPVILCGYDTRSLRLSIEGVSEQSAQENIWT
jgi:hypothetical protein